MAENDITPPSTIPPAEGAPSLPNPDINHTTNYVNETQNRLHAFGSALAALRTAKEGAETRHTQELAELNAKHLKAVSEAEEAHLQKVAELDRLIDDMQTAEKMAQAAYDARPHE